MTTCSRSSARGTSGPPQSWHASPSPVALVPHSAQTMREASRRMTSASAQHNLDDDERSPSGDDFIERTAPGDRPWKPVEQEARLACPAAASRSVTTRVMTSSLIRPPVSMIAATSRPSGVPA